MLSFYNNKHNTNETIGNPGGKGSKKGEMKSLARYLTNIKFLFK